MAKQQLKDKHSFINDTIFRLKIAVLIGIRIAQNVLKPTQKCITSKQRINEQIISVSESELWNPLDNQDNWILTAGKIENLRIAAKAINGIEVQANQIFSFWKHIGNPNLGKRYVVGREIREGCIVPTIAGGLCQLSNAIYDAALKAGFKIVERHKHTKVIQGSLAENNRDASVKWNYKDLRFSANVAFRIDVELTADRLIVRLKSSQNQPASNEFREEIRATSKLNDCFSCGNNTCYKHHQRSEEEAQSAKTTFILDEKWLEFDHHLKIIGKESDHFIVPLKKGIFIKTDRYSWLAMKGGKIKATTLAGIWRALKLRYATKKKNNSFELSLGLDKKIAEAASRKISIESAHLVISQNLLPFIFESGALGGRTYDVLMTRLPIDKLHERLDFAHSSHRESRTLNDFRASDQLIALENLALTRARRVITAHTEIAELFNKNVEKLNWHIPEGNNEPIKGKKILFPAASVGRKGSFEMKRLARELNLKISISGKLLEGEDFWEDVKVEKFEGDFSEIGLIIYPTYVEHQPRQILRAIGKGIPVITTDACGIDSSENVVIVPVGDYQRFKNEVIKQLDNL